MKHTQSNLDWMKKNDLIIDMNDVAHLFKKDLVPEESLLVVGGSKETPSPPFLSSMAAKHCGAKSATIASTKEVIKLANASGNQRFIPLDDFSPESFKKKVLPDLRKRQYPAILIGPGLSSRKNDLEGVKYFIKKVPKSKTIIIDANALDLVVDSKDILKEVKAKVVITPNIKEFSEITGKNVKELKERAKNVKAFSKKYGIVTLQKGKGDVISDGKSKKINISGEPALAVSGSGDTLAGCIGGFLCVTKKPLESTVAGMFIFGRAGDRVFGKKGYSLEPIDIIEELDDIISEIVVYDTVDVMRISRSKNKRSK